jgi:type I restriction enzyme, R subunit
MSPTDTSEAGLESLIVASLTGLPVRDVSGGLPVQDAPVPYGGAGYILGSAGDYDRYPEKQDPGDLWRTLLRR